MASTQAVSAPKNRKRKDPAPRPASYAFDPTALVEDSKDPGRVYCFAAKRASHMGVQHREQLGWQIEVARPDGVRLVIGSVAKVGEPIEYMDCVLMSIDRQTWERAEQEGWYGNAGQNLTDAFSKRIRKNGSPDGGRAMPRVEHVNVRSAVAEQDAYSDEE